MFENIKLIVADIDGTITSSHYSTSKRNIDAFEKLREKGMLIGLASGRPLDDVINKYKDWGMKDQFDLIIAWNGSQIFDKKDDKTYQFNFLKKEEIKEIVDMMHEFDCVVSMYEGRKYVSNKKTDKVAQSVFKNQREFLYAEDDLYFSKHDNGGIMFRTELDNVAQIEAKIAKETVGKNYIGFKTQADLIEFSNKDCNKGYALKKYCEIHNLSLDDCMAFGDTTNDNKMLEACYGVCLKNGSDDTKACAKQITDLVCDEDGFADYIEKNLL